MTQDAGSRLHRRQRPGRPGRRRRARCARSTWSAASASRMASGSRSSATGPRCSPRPSSATGCCSTRSPAIPVSSRSRSCRSTGPRTSTGPARSRPASAGSGWRVSSRPVAACRRNRGPRRGGDGAPALRADQGLGVVGGDRGRDRGTRRPGRPDRQPLHDLGRGPRRRPAIRASPPRHELDGPFPRDRDGGRRAGCRARPVRQRFAVPGHPVVDQRDPRRPRSRTTRSGRSWPATRHVCSASGTRPSS